MASVSEPADAAQAAARATLLRRQKRRDKFREALAAVATKAFRDYDKTVLTLSSGALGVSFFFIKDVLGVAPIRVPWAAFIAWSSWALSLTCTLGSLYAGALLNNIAVKKLADITKTVDDVSGTSNKWMHAINIFAGLLFVAGVVALAIFVWQNLGGIGANKKT